jgi:predicted HicB family RNase H-like nuclease
MHKHLKVKSETHEKVKKNAKQQKKTIDQYINDVLIVHETMNQINKK